jgi:hypothetical protein
MRPALATLVVVLTVLSLTACGSNGDALTEEKIKSVLEDQPFEYDYRDVSYSGDGAVVAGAARDDRSVTHFAVIAGSPTFSGRLLPKSKNVIGTFGNGLTVKALATPRWNQEFLTDIDFALCEAQEGHNCGV